MDYLLNDAIKYYLPEIQVTKSNETSGLIWDIDLLGEILVTYTATSPEALFKTVKTPICLSTLNLNGGKADTKGHSVRIS